MQQRCIPLHRAHLCAQLLWQRPQCAARQVGQQPRPLCPPQRAPTPLQRDLHRPVPQYKLGPHRVGCIRSRRKLSAGADSQAVCSASR
jgi:hypothetical protein